MFFKDFKIRFMRGAQARRERERERETQREREGERERERDRERSHGDKTGDTLTKLEIHLLSSY